MDCFEQISIKMQKALLDTGKYTESDIKQITDILCVVTQGYEITAKSTDIIPLEVIPKSLYEYLACLKMEGRSAGTIYNYKSLLEKMFSAISKPLDKITHKDIRGFLIYYQNKITEKPVSSRTMNAYLGYIKYFFKWAVDIGYIAADPTSTISPIKYEKKIRQSMDRHDLITLFSACKSKKELALITVMYATGCRVSEVARIQKNDINLYTKSITVFGKGKKYRTVYFNDQAEIALTEYLNSRKDDCPFVFVSDRGAHSVNAAALRETVEKVYKRVENKISVPVSPHVIRHTTATLSIESGMPVVSVQKILGHEKLDTTMQYVDMQKIDIKQEYTKYVI